MFSWIYKLKFNRKKGHGADEWKPHKSNCFISSSALTCATGFKSTNHRSQFALRIQTISVLIRWRMSGVLVIHRVILFFFLNMSHSLFVDACAGHTPRVLDRTDHTCWWRGSDKEYTTGGQSGIHGRAQPRQILWALAMCSVKSPSLNEGRSDHDPQLLENTAVWRTQIMRLIPDAF